MPPVHIISGDDSRLDDYRGIPDPELLATRGLFAAEGRIVVRRLIEHSRFSTRSLLVTPAALEDLADLMPRVTAPVFVVAQQVMDAVAGFNFHRGCLALGARPAPASWREIAAGTRLVVVLEQIANPDNVGAVFRSAAAFGAGAVLLDPASVDPLYRKAIRTSMGTSLRLPFARMTDWPADLARLRGLGFTIVALTPSTDAVPLAEWRGPRTGQAPRTALLLGHEGSGLSDEALQHAEVRARIPMADGVDSLNLAAAAAIALYELSRSA